MKFKKIIPSILPSSNRVSSNINLIFISEGFLIEDEKYFWNLLNYFSQKLNTTFPFSIASQNSNFINVYGCFLSSKIKGANLQGDFINNSNLLDSYYNSTSLRLMVDESKLIDLAKKIVINNNGNEINFKKVLSENYVQTEYSNLFIILIPENDITELDGELESINNSQVNYIAFTTKGRWEQFVFKSIGKMLGLADEFELSDENSLEPDRHEKELISFHSPNLFCFEENESENFSSSLKWKSFTSVFNNPPHVINVKDYNFPNESLPNNNFSNSKILFTEGGGGYRKGVFRSSKDCLMRRRFNSKTLPIRESKIPFCFICEDYLKNIILNIIS